MNSYKIKDLHNLLKQYFKDEVKLVHYEAKPLTSKGENFGSEILDLEIKLQYVDSEKTLRLVAKMCPPTEILKEVFATAVTFKKEIYAYNIILPTLLKFQQETCGRNCEKLYAECFGTRLNLNLNMDTIDDDAVILLENLKLSQFAVKDRMIGFNLEETELALETLSTFHAIALAFKNKHPDIFFQRILPHLTRNTIFDIVDEKSEKMDLDFVLDTASMNEQCKIHIDVIIENMKIGLENHRKTSVRELFATISHNDFWVNNILLKSGERKCKIIDFQLMDYGSLANDLLFFLFTSVQEDVLNLQLKYLISFYYDSFLRTLKEMNCDMQQFTVDSFMEEIEICAKTKQFYHIMVMLRIIFGVKEKMKDLNEITIDDLSSNDYVSPECQQRVITTILHFAKNNWI
ncbi:hypothetical protein RN001_002454 [Aquatica leii]|uniref:CHK kinase-like domain-containing protein n=1 Tax=Aquatica leii TaxID=1421715 RepID=A0AAN7SR86_9COLE|nr:hypothetical protein RN001_002454 [Aquatica leii]